MEEVSERDINMTNAHHLQSLKNQRERIAKGEKLWWDDDTTIGNKHTECSWGLCSESKDVYPDKEMHLWPDQFEEHGRVAPRYRKGDQKCPFDRRKPEEVTMNGCFWTCRVFKWKRKKEPRITQEIALQLYDEEILRYEALMAEVKDESKGTEGSAV
jgi:hypothetical protein